MRIVPIPPTCLIQECRKFTYQFCLTHVYTENAEYATAYREIGHSGKNYLILDNGAFENGSSDSLETLLAVIDDVNPNEVVLPDRMFMADETLEKSAHALAILKGKHPRIKYQGVIHGRTLTEWVDCMYGLIKLGVDVLAIPKDYEAWDGGRGLLLHFIPKGIPVHLLGQERDLTAIYNWRADLRDKVRSIDTAKPFVYALNGIKTPINEVPSYPRRPRDYFKMGAAFMDPDVNRIMKYNLEVWATHARSKDDIATVR